MRRVKTKKETFHTKDALRLVGVWHAPEIPTQKAVILAHGITADKDEEGIFVDLANLLAKNGFAVFRFDFRGHGESDGKSVDMTITGEMNDLNAAVEHVRSKGYLMIGLLGASFGGGTAALWVAKNQEKIHCLSLWNPVLNYDYTFLNPTLPWIVKRKGRMKRDIATKGWTTLGSGNFKVGNALFDEMERLFPYDAMKRIIIPTQVIHGDKDKHVPYDDSREYVQNLTGTIEFIPIRGAEHGFHGRSKDAQHANNATLRFFQKYL